MFSSQEADAFILSMKYLNVSHTILGLLGMCSYIIINPVENIQMETHNNFLLAPVLAK